MTIEPARAEDLPRVFQLYTMLNREMAQLQPDMFRPGAADEKFVRSVLASGEEDVLVAREGEEVLGFALVQQKETPPYPAFLPRKYVYLMDLAVDPNHQGQGLGKALLQGVEDWARGRGAEFVELGVLAENARAIGLYESRGFQETRKVMKLDLI